MSKVKRISDSHFEKFFDICILMKSLDEIKKLAVPVLKKYNISKAGIFGSFAKKQQSEQSDIDMLVELSAKISLLDFIGIKLELEDLIGIKVDLVEYKSIKPLLKDDILRQEVSIL